MTYCEKHEMSNCAECSGAAKAFDQTMNASPEYDDGPLPVVPGATVIRSQYDGTCSGCGRRYYENQTIFRPRDPNRDFGWQGYACCGKI